MGTLASARTSVRGETALLLVPGVRPGRLAALRGVLDAGRSQLVVCASRRRPNNKGEICRVAAVAVRDTGVLVKDRALGGEVVCPARGGRGNHGRHGAGGFSYQEALQCLLARGTLRALQEQFLLQNIYHWLPMSTR